MMLFHNLSALCLCVLLAVIQARPEANNLNKQLNNNELELEAHTIVAEVNSAQAGWTAHAHPRFSKMTIEERKFLLGLQIPDKATLEQRAKDNRPETPIPDNGDIPETFDPREKWPFCADVFNNIRDQSRCGDCWAVAAAGALSDRFCIKSEGTMNVSISDIDTAECAQEGHDGCQGASDLSPAWKYFYHTGVVSGSNYPLQTGCKPYPFPLSKDATRDYKTPRCTGVCSNRKFDKSYKDDKYWAESPIVMHSKDRKKTVELIQREVMANGSVEVGFIVFQDFFYYKGGVYRHVSGPAEGGHAVRLIGWGVEKGVSYWLIANSWSDDWGESGFFKIRRGTDEAYIETMTDPYAGNPHL